MLVSHLSQLGQLRASQKKRSAEFQSAQTKRKRCAKLRQNQPRKGTPKGLNLSGGGACSVCSKYAPTPNPDACENRPTALSWLCKTRCVPTWSERRLSSALDDTSRRANLQKRSPGLPASLSGITLVLLYVMLYSKCLPTSCCQRSHPERRFSSRR